jgi:hypothetical protein
LTARLPDDNQGHPTDLGAAKGCLHGLAIAGAVWGAIILAIWLLVG